MLYLSFISKYNSSGPFYEISKGSKKSKDALFKFYKQTQFYRPGYLNKFLQSASMQPTAQASKAQKAIQEWSVCDYGTTYPSKVCVA